MSERRREREIREINRQREIDREREIREREREREKKKDNVCVNKREGEIERMYAIEGERKGE